MADIRSSHIKAVDHTDDVLKVTFANGKTYHYRGVKRSLYQQMLLSRSKGGFLHRWVLPRFKGMLQK